MTKRSKVEVKKENLVCEGCKSVVDITNEYCGKCGSRLEVSLKLYEWCKEKRCGAKVAKTSRYCTECGKLR